MAATEKSVRSRFLKAFNDIPEEKERRRMAPDGRNEVGFSWRLDGEPGRRELEDVLVCSHLSFSLRATRPLSLLASLSLFLRSLLPASLSSSIRVCLHARVADYAHLHTYSELRACGPSVYRSPTERRISGSSDEEDSLLCELWEK